ncbi:MAG TPA: sulfite exporter TauE/SafE family protein [Gemmatimonadaceae bacterium]
MIGLGLALAALIGLSLGLLGGGGSILTVPVLVYVLGFDAKPAIAMSLPVVGVTSLIGAALHWRLGNVRITTALAFGVLAMAGAFAGAKLSVLLSGAVQLALLAVVMLAAAASMLRGGGAGRVPVRDGAPAAPPRIAMLVPIALGVGVLTGLVGIGGGFLVVPALVLLARVPMRQAVGTSLLVIAMNSASGFAGYLGTVRLDWSFLTGFTAAAVAGALVGTALIVRVPQATLKRAFAGFLLVMGGFVLYKNRGAFRGVVAPTSSSPASPAATVALAR